MTLIGERHRKGSNRCNEFALVWVVPTIILYLIIETHGYVWEYQWVCVLAYKWGNIATERLNQDVFTAKAFVSRITDLISCQMNDYI